MHPSNNHNSPSSPTAVILIVLFFFLVQRSSAAVDSFVYVGCSQAKFTAGSPYENSVDSVLTSLVNSASFSSFNKLSIGGSGTGGAVYGLFQCRPDLSNSNCSDCVSRSVTQLAVLCSNSAGAVLQLDGCLIRYDNVAFLGVEDKSLVSKKCGPTQLGYGEITRRDSVLGYLAGGAQSQQQLFRVAGSGSVQGVAECVGDLSAAQCQDCLADAVGRLKTDCGAAAWADVYLGKCYARYSLAGSHAHTNSGNGSTREEDETEKTLAILIGLIAVVAVAVIFLAFLRKLCEEKGGK